MLGEAEDRRAALGVVAADALEDPGAVVQAVRADVDPGVRPVHELAVHPDLLGLLHVRLLSWQMLLVLGDIDRLAAGDPDELGRRQPGHVRVRSRRRPRRRRSPSRRWSISTRSTPRSPNGATAAGRIAGRLLDLLRAAPRVPSRRRSPPRPSSRRRDGRRGRARARRCPSQSKTQRLDDLPQLTADGAARRPRRSASRSANSSTRASAPACSERRAPGSTGSGQAFAGYSVQATASPLRTHVLRRPAR